MQTSTHKINVAVVGAGLLGSRHARVFREMTGSNLAAVVDLNLARAQDVAGKLDAKAYASLDDALNDASIDAVSVATPDHLHFDALMTAIRAGKAVLVEKPLATTAQEARQIVAAVKSSGVTAMVNYSQRYVNDYAWIKQRIVNGEIGQPQFAISVKFDTISVPTGMIRSWAAQTSPIYFMSSHDLDLVQWYLDAQPVEVVANEVSGTLQAQGIAVHDGLNALIQFARGDGRRISTNFHASWIHPNTYPAVADGYMQIIGSEGAITYNNRLRVADIYNARGGQKLEFVGPHTANEVNGKIAGAFVLALQHFLDCVRDGREPETSPAKTLPIALAQAAVMDSLRVKQPVAVPAS